MNIMHTRRTPAAPRAARRSGRLRTAAGVLALAAGTGLSAVIAAPSAGAEPTDPVQTAPVWSGLDTRDAAPDLAPGRSGAVVSLDPSVSLASAWKAYRQTYGTTNQFGDQATSSGAVFLPKGEAPEGGWPVIAWAHGTTGLGDDCAPSTQPRSARDAEYLNHWLDQGYAVVATDYAGLGTPNLLSYLNGEVAAHNVVDSVAAARDAKLPLSAKYSIVGQSQGAGAAMNTAARAPGLSAPYGLDYRGVVATGTPANIEAIFQYAAPGFPPIDLPQGLNIYSVYILTALRDAHPELDINSFLSPEGVGLLDQAETLCYSSMADAVGDTQVGKLVTRPLAEIPNFYGILHDFMGTPDRGYDKPVFLGQGLMDIDVPAPFALSLAAQMALNAQPPELHVYPTQDHSGTVGASTPDSTAFLQRVMA